MSYWKQQEIIDFTNNLAQVSPYGEMHEVSPVRIAGGMFGNSSVTNTNYFTVTNTNGGTATSANGQITLATNTTANGATLVQTAQVGRFVGGTSNRYYARIALGDAGTANNTRRWGLSDSGQQNGVYFKLTGTTFEVATLKAGTETVLATITAPTLTDFNLFVIDYNCDTIYFIINGTLAYESTSPQLYSDTMQFQGFIDNVNSSSSTTNVDLYCAQMTVYRLGALSTQPIGGRITTAATYNFKYGPGLLHRLTLNNPGGTAITVYDSTTGSGTELAVINTPAQANPVTLEYMVQFTNGLTVVSTGTWDATIVFE